MNVSDGAIQAPVLNAGIQSRATPLSVHVEDVVLDVKNGAFPMSVETNVTMEIIVTSLETTDASASCNMLPLPATFFNDVHLSHGDNKSSISSVTLTHNDNTLNVTMNNTNKDVVSTNPTLSAIVPSFFIMPNNMYALQLLRGTKFNGHVGRVTVRYVSTDVIVPPEANVDGDKGLTCKWDLALNLDQFSDAVFGNAKLRIAFPKPSHEVILDTFGIADKSVNMVTLRRYMKDNGVLLVHKEVTLEPRRFATTAANASITMSTANTASVMHVPLTNVGVGTTPSDTTMNAVVDTACVVRNKTAVMYMLTQLMEFNNTSVLIKHGDHVYPVLFRCLELAAPDLEVILPLAKSNLRAIIRKTEKGEYAYALRKTAYATKLLLPVLREIERFLDTQLVDTLDRLRHPTTVATKFVASMRYTPAHNEVLGAMEMWSRVVHLTGGHASDGQVTEAIVDLIMVLSKGVMVNLPATQCALDGLVKRISGNGVEWPDPQPVHVARRPTVLITPVTSTQRSLESFLGAHFDTQTTAGVLQMGARGKVAHPCRVAGANTFTVAVDEADVESFSAAIKKTFQAVARFDACDQDMLARREGCKGRFFTTNAPSIAEADFDLPGKPAAEAFTGLVDVVMHDVYVGPGFVCTNTTVVERGTNALVELPKASTCALLAGARPRCQVFKLKTAADPIGSIGTMLNLMVGMGLKEAQKKAEQDAGG